jgi:serine/threonine protein kinase
VDPADELEKKPSVAELHPHSATIDSNMPLKQPAAVPTTNSVVQSQQQAEFSGSSAELPSIDGTVLKTCSICDMDFRGEVRCPADGGMLYPKRIDSILGLTIGSYTVTNRISEGGCAAVYKAVHNTLSRTVAIKVMHDRLVSQDSMVRRFEKEAKVLSLLEHNNIAQVYDFGVLDDGRPFIIMQFVDGESLADLIKRNGALSVKEALPILYGIANGLAAVHEQGLLHRDLKPSNILIEKNSSTAKIVDFGIAKSGNDQASMLTQTGETIGTPSYMSPEQCQGNELDARTDIYSFGCVMYEVLSGAQAFSGRSIMDIMYKHLHEEPAQFDSGLCLPLPLQAVIFHCLSKDHNARYASVRDVLEDVDKANRGEKPSIQATNTVSSNTQIASTGKPSKLKLTLIGAAVMGACAIFWIICSIDGPLRPTKDPKDLITNAVDSDMKAYEYFLNGNYNKCIKLLKVGENDLETMAQADPDRRRNHRIRYTLAEKRFFIGQCYSRKNDYKQAVQYMEAAWQEFNYVHRLHPNANDCAHEFAQLLRKTGRVAEAAKVDADFQTFRAN